MRSEFEKWFKTTEAYKLLEEMNYFKIDLFTFKEHRSQYQHTSVQIAYMTWNHRQTEVDDLKLDYSKAKLSDIRHASLARDVIFERDDLQKRVDAALGHLDDVNFPPDYEDAWESFYKAEQALKGDQLITQQTPT